MKKVLHFIINSFVLFWSYFISSTLIMIVPQIIFRTFITANSRGEYLWKAIFMYAWIMITCIIHLRITSPTHKQKYLNYVKEKEWSFKETLKYTLKNTDFWLNSIGFAIWPVFLPRLFGAINRLYVTPTFYESFPLSILSILTVSLPIIIISAIAWIIILRHWCQKRMHKH